MPTAFPSAKDALARPGSATWMDDPGYEGDVIIDNISDAVEAIETKLGTGASVPAASTVLRGTGAGTSAFGQIAAADIGDAQVVQGKLGADAVLTANIVDAQVTTAKLAANAATHLWTTLAVTSGPSTSQLIGSGTVLMPNMAVTTSLVVGLVVLLFEGGFSISGPGNTIFLDLFDVTTGTLLARRSFAPSTAGYGVVVAFHLTTGLSVGAHTIEARWAVTGGTVTNTGTDRRLTVVEFRR